MTKVEKAPPFNGSATALTWTSSPARIYAIEGSNDLGISQPWSISNLDPETILPDDGATTTRTSQHLATDERFFRVKAMLPLQP